MGRAATSSVAKIREGEGGKSADFADDGTNKKWVCNGCSGEFYTINMTAIALLLTWVVAVGWEGGITIVDGRISHCRG